MGLFDKFRSWLLEPMIGSASRAFIEGVERVRDYYSGDQKLPLKVKANQVDYNVIANMIKVIVDRSVYMLFGYGVQFDLPGDDDTEEAIYIDEVWDLNKQQVLLQNTAEVGTMTGTCVIKIIPDGLHSEKLGKDVPRLVLLDSALLTIKTLPSDVGQHTKYIYQYSYYDDDGKEKAHKQEITRLVSTDGTITWEVVDYEIDNSNKWVEQSRVPWNHYFPPLVVWQNLPDFRKATGKPDITSDTLRAQDKLNFVISDLVKTNALFAHPKLIVRDSDLTGIDNAVDAVLKISGPTAEAYMLEMKSEMAGGLALFTKLRSVLFENTHTVDTDALVGGTGDMTNFRVKIVYQDALQKLGIKRELYGEALKALNKYMLILAGFTNSDPGEIVWPEVVPTNEQEEVVGIQSDVGMGISSKQTAAAKRGYDWEAEQERMAAEKADESTLGDRLLAGFDRGG